MAYTEEKRDEDGCCATCGRDLVSRDTDGDQALAYLRRIHEARIGTEDKDWLRADRLLRASIILLDLEGERLSLKGIQAVSELAIELAEEIGGKVP